MTKKEVINYWIKSSDSDYLAMQNMYKSKDYCWCLFVGHLVIEKLIKACYVNLHGTSPPPIHNLFKLANDSNLTLSK